MKNRKELAAWLRSQGMDADTSNVEVFDEAAMRKDFGVSKMPAPLDDPLVADAEIRRELAREAPGETIAGKEVLVEFDIDATGRVTSVRAIDPPPLPEGVDAVVAMVVDRSGAILHVRESDSRNSSDALKRAAERALGRVARFAPAELDGRPVPFKGLRSTWAFD
jgi:hypothetical protein